jgi:hypothetical protein
VSLAALMVHVEPDDSCLGRLRLAAELARRFDAALIGVSSCILPPYPAETGYFVTPPYIEQERLDIKSWLGRCESAFQAIVGPDRGRAEWRSDIEIPDTFISIPTLSLSVGIREMAVSAARSIPRSRC